MEHIMIVGGLEVEVTVVKYRRAELPFVQEACFTCRDDAFTFYKAVEDLSGYEMVSLCPYAIQ